MRIERWTALYLPSRAEGQGDPSKFDFLSKDAAEEYIFTMMCKTCREERERCLNGTSDPEDEHHQFDSLYPGCFCEWMVLKTKDYNKCEDFGDLMDAVGAKTIYRKEDVAQE